MITYFATGLGPGAGQAARRGRLSAAERDVHLQPTPRMGWPGDVHSAFVAGRLVGVANCRRSPGGFVYFVGHARGRRRGRTDHGYRPESTTAGGWNALTKFAGQNHPPPPVCSSQLGVAWERALHPDRRRSATIVLDQVSSILLTLAPDGGDRQRDELRRRASTGWPPGLGLITAVGHMHLLRGPACATHGRRCSVSNPACG